MKNVNHLWNCTIYLRLKGGKKIILCPKQIVTKGAKEHYVIGGYKLHNELSELFRI